MKSVSLLLALLITSISYAANEREIWECRGFYNIGTKTLVTATADRTAGQGTIKVAGVSYDTRFEIAGFDRQWQFGRNSGTGTYQYVFRIKPDGIAHYFDISTAGNGKPVKSSMVLNCRMQGSGWSASLSGDVPEEAVGGARDQSRDRTGILPCTPGLLILNVDE